MVGFDDIHGRPEAEPYCAGCDTADNRCAELEAERDAALELLEWYAADGVETLGSGNKWLHYRGNVYSADRGVVIALRSARAKAEGGG
jgi:hypothetical protein